MSGLRAAKEPPSFKQENLRTATLCDISRAVLHQLSLSRTRTKQPRNFRKVEHKSWIPGTELGEIHCSGRCLGQSSFTPRAPSPAPRCPGGFMWLLTLSALARGCFWGGWVSFPVGQPRVPMPSPAAESSPPPSPSPRLARRPAAFHCRLFIRLNSLRFLSCSLRGTEGELVPADGPHPPHPAPLERGLEKRDAGEGGNLPPLRGPRAASQQIR